MFNSLPKNRTKIEFNTFTLIFESTERSVNVYPATPTLKYKQKVVHAYVKS